MGWASYFRKAQKNKEDYFLEFTDKELTSYNRYRMIFIIFLLLAIVFSWTGIGLAIGIVVVIVCLFRMNRIRTAVYRRYLHKKRK